MYWSSNPSDNRYSISGDEFPYHNPDIAFSNSYNSGITYVKDGEIHFSIYYPNSFYASNGTILIEPILFYRAEHSKNDIKMIKLNKSNTNKDLNKQIPIHINNSNLSILKTQEDIIREKGF